MSKYNRLFFVLVIFFSLFAKADSGLNSPTYSSKFWVWSSSMQVQITNNQSKSSVILFLNYTPSKDRLLSYEIEHAGKDTVLEQIKSPKDFYNLILFVEERSVEHLGIHAPRFTSFDESIVARSAFGQVSEQLLHRSRKISSKAFDVEMVRILMHNLFYDSATVATAVDISHYGRTCSRFLK